MAKNTGYGSRHAAEARRKLAAGEDFSTWEYRPQSTGSFIETRNAAQLNGGWLEASPRSTHVRWWQFWKRGW
jgi:hypothetical protein